MPALLEGSFGVPIKGSTDMASPSCDADGDPSAGMDEATLRKNSSMYCRDSGSYYRGLHGQSARAPKNTTGGIET